MELLGNTVKLMPFDDSDLDLFVRNSMSPTMMKHVYDPLTLSQAKSNFAERV